LKGSALSAWGALARNRCQGEGRPAAARPLGGWRLCSIESGRVVGGATRRRAAARGLRGPRPYPIPRGCWGRARLRRLQRRGPAGGGRGWGCGWRSARARGQRGKARGRGRGRGAGAERGAGPWRGALGTQAAQVTCRAQRKPRRAPACGAPAGGRRPGWPRVTRPRPYIWPGGGGRGAPARGAGRAAPAAAPERARSKPLAPPPAPPAPSLPAPRRPYYTPSGAGCLIRRPHGRRGRPSRPAPPAPPRPPRPPRARTPAGFPRRRVGLKAVPTGASDRRSGPRPVRGRGVGQRPGDTGRPPPARCIGAFRAAKA
jgi:hypothetical protein